MIRNQDTPRRGYDGGRHVLDAPTHNPNARIMPGFCIHRDTLEQLGPLEREFARRLIAEGTWNLVDDEEATP